MSIENRKPKSNIENPKKRPEFLDWKNSIVKKLKEKGLDVTSDEEFFILTIKDAEENFKKIYIQAWEKIPVLKDPQDQNVDMFPVEDVLEADALYFAQNPDGNESWFSRKALDNLYKIREEEKKKK